MQTKKVRFVSTIRWGARNGEYWTCAGCGYDVQWIGLVSKKTGYYTEVHSPCVECGSTVVRMKRAYDQDRELQEKRAALRQLALLRGTLEAITNDPGMMARSLAFKLGIA